MIGNISPLACSLTEPEALTRSALGTACVLLVPVSAKRSSAGRPVKSKPSKPSKLAKTPKQKFLNVLKWAGASFLVLALLAVGGFVVLYNAIEMPDPNAEFNTQTSFVYYQDGKGEVGRFETQNRESI